MPRVSRPDGAEIEWEANGLGPLVVLVAHFYAFPGVLADLNADLARDHRMVTYDRRGAGASSRKGPYDFGTDAADMTAVIEAARLDEGAAVVLGWGDGAMLASREAVGRPDLIAAVVAVGGLPMTVAQFATTDSAIGSETVRDAIGQAIQADPRSGIRQLIRQSNLQMSEEEVRERVDAQVAYCSQEALAKRFQAWSSEDAIAEAAELGDRFSVLLFETNFGPPAEIARHARSLLPRARVSVLDDGPISRPDLTAEAVRDLTQPSRS